MTEQELCSDLIAFLNERNMADKPKATLCGLSMAMVAVADSVRELHPTKAHEITEVLFDCTQNMPVLLGEVAKLRQAGR